jgi:ribonuclease P protein component
MNDNRQNSSGQAVGMNNSRRASSDGQNGVKAGFKRYGKHYAVVKKNREFSFLFKKGETAGNPAFVAYYRQNNRRVNRLGIVTSKKAGNAVKRSRARRLLREAFRLLEPDLLSQTDRRFDLIIVARESLAALKMQDVKLRLQRVFVRMLNSNPAAARPNRPPQNPGAKRQNSAGKPPGNSTNRRNNAGSGANRHNNAGNSEKPSTKQ